VGGGGEGTQQSDLITLLLFFQNKESRQNKRYIVWTPLLNNLRIVEPEEMAVARQQLGKHVAMAMNTHVTVEEVLDKVVSVPSSSYQILNI
jgi:hypothetical protein